jgi:hypothetical protein
MSILPAASGLLLWLATGSFAAPIVAEHSEGGRGGYWSMPITQPPCAKAWAFGAAHHSHGLNLRAWQPGSAHRGHEVAHPPLGLGKWDEQFRVRPWLCGGVSGEGSSQYLSEGPDSETPDFEEPQTGDDDAATRISASGDLDRANPIQAVPEPGSLAMLGAGVLGLLLARRVLKDH